MMWKSSYRMPMRSANAWQNDMRRLNRQMDHLLGGTRGPIRRDYPLLNAWSGENGLVIVAEMPGIVEDELEITVEGRTLTLSGNRQVAELPEDARHLRRERSNGEFNRSVELPYDINVEAVQAKYANGVLEIELPRLPEEKPRKISIGSN